MPKPKVRRPKGKIDLNLDNGKISGTKKKQWILTAIEMMKEGKSGSYIREHIRTFKEGSVSETAINEIFSEANLILTTDQYQKSTELTAIHVSRYNTTINRLLAVEELDQELIDSEEEGGISYETWMKSREKKIKAYLQCIDTMIQKESLLQYHNKDFTFDVNIDETIEIKEVKPKYDVSKLTFEEQLELYGIIRECKKDENQLASVLEVVREQKTETIDVEHQVIEQANIEQIKQKEIEPEHYVSPVTQFDPTILLRKKLKEAAAREIQRVGGNLTEEEKKHLKD